MEKTIASHIEITPGVCGGKPRIAGHRIRVQDIVAWSEHDGQRPEEIVARFPRLTLADVRAALAYYSDHVDEIHGDMQRDAEFADAMKKKLGPGPLAKKLQGTDGDRDSVSS
jgi:uncharacterized protein (DUF433 family)